MGWTEWTLASAVFLALYDLAKKASVQRNAVLPTLLCSTCFGCAAYVGTLALCGRISVASGLSPEILALSAVKCLIVGTSWVFTFCALRTLPISIATPIRASAPAIVFVVAFIVYDERPSPIQLVGMAAVFAGYFAFSWAGKHEGIDFFRNRAVWCAVAGAFFSALSSLWDKYIFQVRALPVETVQFVFQIGLVVFYGVALAVVYAAPGRRERGAFEWRWTIPLVGILLAVADWMYFTGLSFQGAPISAASLLRRFSVVITFFLGAKFFHETNLVRKAVALAVILAGVVLICLGR